MDSVNQENRIEKIGSVTLDLEFYPGEDYYCDGAAEDELLDIVMHHGREEYGRIIEEKNTWEILYHLSPLRANIIDWLPVKPGAKGLEIGSGCGAVTGALAGKCKELTCIDLSKKRSMINAYRNRERENVTIKVGNFKDIEPSLDQDYDYIFLIGVFEYAKGYIGGEAPYTEFLNIIRKHLAPDGKIVIAIENKYGLKYFAGCREDHLGEYFAGIEDYPAGGDDGGVVRTFGRNGLEKICKECGVSEYTFYYPYPDYKFMTTLYSDRRLPKPGELTTNLRNMDRSRLLLFDEKNAFDGIIREGEFPFFSNSYLLLIGKEEETAYAKFSNDRAKEYAIRTDIVRLPSGQMQVEKHALTQEAGAHLKNIFDAGEKLIRRFDGSGLWVCPCEWNTDRQGKSYLCFPYLPGETLESRLDDCLERRDMDAFYGLLGKYLELVRYRAQAQVTDYDFIFSNLLIDGERWQLIDYEWTYDELIPPDQVAYRALLCYCMGSEKRKACRIDAMAARLGLEGIQPEDFSREELRFQMKVTGERMSLSQIRDSIHHEALPLRDAVEICQNQKAAGLVQLYWDRGEGFSEEGSEWMEPRQEEGGALHVSVPIAEGIRSLRFDPARYACLVSFEEISCRQGSGSGAFPKETKPVSPGTVQSGEWQSVCYPWKRLAHNGVEIAPQVYLFWHEDPNFTIDCRYAGEASQIDLSYHITKLDPDTAARFTGRWKWKN